MERKAVSTRRRFEIFKRDNFTCMYYGKKPPSVILHIDHIIPVSKGGGNGTENLVTSCDKCNLGKSDVPLESVPESLADRAASIKEAEKQLRAYRKVFREQEERILSDCWDVVRELFGESTVETKKAILQSIRRFIELIGYEDTLISAGIASAKSFYGNDRTFRYFCAVCWKKAREATQ